jgi:ATP adenylyltransferase
MSYDRLWAPWRLSYVRSAAGESQQDGGRCFLCRYREEKRDDENFVVQRSQSAFVVLNRFPYNNGHLLVAPLAHKARLDELEEGELLDCQRQIQAMVRLYERVLKPDGFNIGLNLGQSAGAGLPGHLHWHVVPRWNGDTNFMTVVDDVRVISQSLQSLYAIVRCELGKALPR